MNPNQSRSAFDANSRGIAVLVAAVVIGFVLLLQAGGSGSGSSSAAPADDATTTTVDLLATSSSVVTTQPGDPAPTDTTEPEGDGGGDEEGDPADTKVAVLNGTRTAGLAAATQQKVVEAGYQAGAQANAAASDVATTTIYFREGSQGPATAIATILGVPSSAVIPYDDSQPNAGADDLVIVVLGADFGG